MRPCRSAALAASLLVLAIAAPCALAAPPSMSPVGRRRAAQRRRRLPLPAGARASRRAAAPSSSATSTAGSCRRSHPTERSVSRSGCARRAGSPGGWASSVAWRPTAPGTSTCSTPRTTACRSSPRRRRISSPASATRPCSIWRAARRTRAAGSAPAGWPSSSRTPAQRPVRVRRRPGQGPRRALHAHPGDAAADRDDVQRRRAWPRPSAGHRARPGRDTRLRRRRRQPSSRRPGSAERSRSSRRSAASARARASCRTPTTSRSTRRRRAGSMSPTTSTTVSTCSTRRRSRRSGRSAASGARPGGSRSCARSAALADDPRGGVDVADTANNRIQALDASGAVLAAWGIAGRGAGYVSRARGVAFAPDGGIAAADTFDHRVVRFDPDGTFAGLFGLVSASTGFATSGAADGQFSVPEGVAYDAAGRLWVADTGNDRVVELDPRAGPCSRRAPPASSLRRSPWRPGRTASSSPTAGTGGSRRSPPDGTTTTLRSGLAHPVAVRRGRHDHRRRGRHPRAEPDRECAGRAAAGGRGLGPPRRTRHRRGDRDALRQRAPPGDRRWGARPARHAVRRRVHVGRRSPPRAPAPARSSTLATSHSAPTAAPCSSPTRATTGSCASTRPGAEPPVTQALGVAVTGITLGVVTSAPAGISCATDCIQHYGTGRQVTLTATALPGDVFGGWSGDCAPAGTTPSCTLTLDAARSAGATFTPAPPPPAPRSAAGPRRPPRSSSRACA